MKKLIYLSALLICTAHPVIAMSSQPSPHEESSTVLNSDSEKDIQESTDLTAGQYLDLEASEKFQVYNQLVAKFVEDAKAQGNQAGAECAEQWLSFKEADKHESKLVQWAEKQPAASIKSLLFYMLKKECGLR